MHEGKYARVDRLYTNPLGSDSDVGGFRLEGRAAVSFPLGRLRMESVTDDVDGKDGNFVFWCPQEFPDRVEISWDFWPIREPGLCILFFAGAGRDGKDLFSDGMEPRDGRYELYHSGDLNAYHVSYFRRKNDKRLHTCNLRKSRGFHLVAQGADPIPPAATAEPPYRMTLICYEGEVEFRVDDLPVLQWTDDGTIGGSRHAGGRIGFRQMAPLIAEYANLEVHTLRRA